jgi:Tfp pilus assembly protein PilF
MRSLFTLLLVPAILLCAADNLYAQGSGSRHLSGTVTYADSGDAAEHVFVELVTSGGSVMSTATTNGSGDFSFFGLAADTYQLEVHSTDYEPVNVSVDLSFTSVNGQVLVLQKRGTAGKKAAGQSVSVHLLSLPTKARDAYEKGNQDLYQKNDPKAAMGDYEKAAKAASGCYEAYEGIGWAYVAMNKPSDGEKAFRKSIEISKDSYVSADIGLGALLVNTQQFAEGEKTLRHALELDAKSWRAYYELGRAALMENKLDDALKNFLQAKTLQPKAPSIYRLLAIVHMKQNNGPDLLDDLDAYIQLDPTSAAGQRAKELRDQVAKMVSPKGIPAKDAASAASGASAPAINPASSAAPISPASAEPAPTLKKPGDDQPPQQNFQATGQDGPATLN